MCESSNLTVFWTSVLSSLIATVIGWGLAYLYIRIQNKNKYGKIEGHFNEFAIGTETDKYTSTTKPTASASIKYLKNNLLDIKVEEVGTSKLTWVGQIAMQSEFYGTVSWFYPNMFTDNQHYFGIKNIIVPQHGCIYLSSGTLGNPQLVLKKVTI